MSSSIAFWTGVYLALLLASLSCSSQAFSRGRRAQRSEYDGFGMRAALDRYVSAAVWGQAVVLSGLSLVVALVLLLVRS